jgi:hypothetical protein
MRQALQSLYFALFLTLVITNVGLPSISMAISGDANVLPVPGGFCLVGQQWPGYDADWIEPETITGNGQTFFALFSPNENCSFATGFKVSTADFYMTFPDDSPLPITITVSMGLKEAIPDQGSPIPWLPGDTICETPVRAFTMYIHKDYVGFGIALECDCLSFEGPYFLFFTIHSKMDPPGGLYTTGEGVPELGRFLTLVDNQLVDMVEVGILTRGDLVVSGSARGCYMPVDVSWGSLPAAVNLHQNYPNPFNPQTMINYDLFEYSTVSLRIFDTGGRLVDVLVEGENQAAGTHSATWTGRDLQGRAMPSGTYFYRLEADRYTETKRMTLIR